MADDNTTRTVGEILQQARRELEMPLDELSVKTRIAVGLLEALESNEFHRLSGELYVKAFLRSVCGCVGLDPNEMLERYSEQTGKSMARPGESEQVDAEPPIPVMPIMARTIKPPGDDAEKDTGDVWSVDSVIVRRASAGSIMFWLKLAGLVVAVGGLIWVLIAQPWRGDGEVSGTVGPALQTTPIDTVQTALDDSLVAVVAAAMALKISPPAPTETSSTLRRAPIWNDQLRFTGGRPQLVLRLLCSEPVALRVESDDHFEVDVSSIAAVPLPDGELELGRPYLVREGVVVFWGANDHFLIRLESRAGLLSLMMNDRPLELPDSILGRPYVLDSFQLQEP